MASCLTQHWTRITLKLAYSDASENRKRACHLWHESLASVAESAKTWCPLCLIVQEALECWIAHYEKVLSSNMFFKEFESDCSIALSRHGLWITKRLEGGDGLTILGRNARTSLSTERPHGVVPITSVAFMVEASSPLSHKVLLRPVNVNSGSSETLEVLAN